MESKRLPWRTLPIFIVICILVSAFGGLFQPGEWYESVNRAPWTPPNIAFPIVWGILYLFIAIAGWLIFARGSARAKQLWIAQLVLNAAWSWLFFGQHWVLVALIDISLMVILVTALVVQCFKEQLTLPGCLLAPYVIWLLLATSLNAYIFLYN